MADFCSLCGYSDMDIDKAYNDLIKPTLMEDIKKLKKKKQFISVDLRGICEHCGIHKFGINNRFEVWGGYLGEVHQFGNVNPETLELVIFEDDPKYNDQRKLMEQEMIQMGMDVQLIKEIGMENYLKLIK